jgi:hypothetical protein
MTYSSSPTKPPDEISKGFRVLVLAGILAAPIAAYWWPPGPNGLQSRYLVH